MSSLQDTWQTQHIQHTLEHEDLTLAQIQAIMLSVLLGGVAVLKEPKSWHPSCRLLVLQC